MQQILRTAGRVVIEEEATEWMRKNGLEALLVENGYNAMRGEVTQGIELNLRTFLDKKSTELLGMPLGGFRSMQAAFRLQARRAVRETVAELLLNFSGNQLVVCLLQRHIVHWVEADLWPQLREAFRPKTHLDRRVRISMGTMEQASEDLNRLVEGRDPTYVLIGDVMKAVERAEGKIQATRYLKRDLQRAQKQELMDDLLAAENILQRDIRRIRHQFLVGDDERWKEMGDNLEYVWGMHASVGTIVQGIPEEKRRIEAAIQRFFQAMMREDTAAVMTLIHEQSPVHSSEAAARLRQYFASHIMQGGGLVVSKIIKESDQDADVTIFDKAEGSGQSVSLVFRRSGETWKLYGPGDGS